MKSTVPLSLLLAAAVLLPTTLCAADPLDHLPADINAIAWMDIAAIYHSPLAKQEGWAKKAVQSLVSNQAVVPPGVESLAVGARMAYDEQFASQSEYAVARLGNDLTLEKFAAVAGGEIDSLNGRKVLVTPRGTQVIGETDDTWLIVGTGGRQAAARWLKDYRNSTGLNVTLRRTVEQKASEEQIVLAFELADLLSPRDIAARLEGVELSGTTVEAAADTLSSVQSAAFYIRVDSAIQGRLVIQLGKPAGPLAPAVLAIRDRVLKRIGASLPELADWSFQVQGDQIVGSGALTAQGARRLVSVLNPPALLAAAAAAGESGSGSAENSRELTIKASQRYLRGVRSTVDDVQETLKERRDNHALWLDKAARQIDDLPLLNVDEELLAYAERVSGSLRYQAQAERSGNIRAGTRKAETGANNVYGYVAYGPYGRPFVGTGNPVSGEAISRQENQASMDVRLTEMKEVEDGYASIRRTLTQKYQAEF
ncbi:MAG: hypothetical protein KF774_11735 [Planctomyces sp.]|nr:hypothetical protein [Planctomyces sp.]